ncbi:MAG: GNAT family N-acetyltransferase [Alphaproteobacteria bacterium]|nr:GNAT family N-acetyltransferase [Alphaproteobacteria bacterium]
MDLNINKPVPISEDHNTDIFCSGNDALDEWLKFKALANEKKRASRCFVITKNNVIIGYYAIAAGSVTHKEATGKIRPISKLANVRRVIGDSARKTGMYPNIHEDLSTETTHQSTTVVEFQDRSIKRNMPDPIPVMILGRLAIDKNYQQMGLGTALLKDALLRTSQAADIIGIKAVLVHAIDQNAVHFYQERGFKSSPIDAKILMVTLDDVIRHMSD